MVRLFAGSKEGVLGPFDFGPLEQYCSQLKDRLNPSTIIAKLDDKAEAAQFTARQAGTVEIAATYDGLASSPVTLKVTAKPQQENPSPAQPPPVAPAPQPAPSTPNKDTACGAEYVIVTSSSEANAAQGPCKTSKANGGSCCESRGWAESSRQVAAAYDIGGGSFRCIVTISCK